MPAPSTSPPLSVDVAVVGAGPAGARAAWRLARSGRQVALIEREALPRYKTCGGGLVGRASLELPPGFALPVEHECRAAVAAFLEAGASFRVERAEPIVSMTMRADLDRRLAEAAVADGATLHASRAVTDVAQDAEGVELATTRGVVRARFVIAADGALSTVARKAGWTAAPRTIPALEAEVRVPEAVRERFAGVARFDFQAIEAGYGWVFPKREHLSCGILTTRRGVGGLHEALDRYLERVGVGPIESQERHGYVIPVRPRRGGLARGRVLLVGDAAGLADPLTGEGISIAMASGRIAAEAVIAGGGAGAEDPTAVRLAYVRGLRREILGELRIARWLAWIAYERPGLLRALLGRRGEAFSERLTDVFLGRSTYRELVSRPGSYWRLVRARTDAATKLST